MKSIEQEKTNQAIGKQTIRFDCPPAILSRASIVGEMEGQGPLASYFDQIEPDPAFGMDSWEEGESEMVRRAVQTAITKSGIDKEKIRYIFGGDLLGQLIGSTFGLKDFQIPIFGLYGACSTCGEALSLAAMTVNAGYASHVIAVTSSHFGGAEKQFRFPLEYGNQRPLSSTWTVTGSGAFLVSATTKDQPMKEYPRITSVTTGKIVDYGVRDSMNMGAAMAPAAAACIQAHLKDFSRSPSYYDKIITGDLGAVGREILLDLLAQKKIDIGSFHTDCGLKIFDNEVQGTGSGGSGCGCAAVTMCAHFLPMLRRGELKRILFVPTGALLSKISFNEGENIPGIAHAVVLEAVEN